MGYVKFYYEDITIGNRNSLKEFNKDVNVRHYLWKIDVGDYIIDIGAGFGSYTLTALAQSAGFVFSFERDGEIASILKNNLGSNLHLRADEKTSVSLWNLNDSTKTIDNYLENLSSPINKIDFIKIDLGSIPDNRVVIWGMKNTIRCYKPNILIADPEPPRPSFLDSYKIETSVDGHSLLIDRFR